MEKETSLGTDIVFASTIIVGGFTGNWTPCCIIVLLGFLMALGKKNG